MALSFLPLQENVNVTESPIEGLVMKKTGCLIIFLLIACFSGRAWCRQVAGHLTRKAVVGRVYKTGKFKAPKPSSAMRTKPDPSRINATPARFFHITDPQIETQAYGVLSASVRERFFRMM